MTQLRLKNKGGARIVRGVIASVLATVLLVLAFAILIAIFNFSDNTIRAVNQVIKLLSIAVGVFAAVGRGGENGLLRGALVGLCYMFFGVIVYALLSGQRLTVYACLLDSLLGFAAGGLMGLLRARS